MSEIKCPVCRTGNIKKYADGQHYACDNEDCPSYDETDERTFDILITTRKALDVARNFIEKIRNNEDTNIFWIKIANDTINKITALEQKD